MYGNKGVMRRKEERNAEVEWGMQWRRERERKM